LIEAMLRRLPIIGSTRGAIPDILANGDCGILCETNADDIRAAIERCRADRPGLARLAARAYDYARTRFAVDSMLSQTLAVYARTR
jgi:glycosyltransferase involved in cell wall biosynthesis